jgi:hypothetical protein
MVPSIVDHRRARSNVAGMRWVDVNMAEALWNQPSASAKNKQATTLPLSAATLDVLTTGATSIDEGYGRHSPCEALVRQRVKGRAWGSINKTGVNAIGAQPTYRGAASSTGRLLDPCRKSCE